MNPNEIVQKVNEQKKIVDEGIKELSALERAIKVTEHNVSVARGRLEVYLEMLQEAREKMTPQMAEAPSPEPAGEPEE
jgi:hypothetical protein